MMCDLSLDLGDVSHLFDIPQENVLDVNGSLYAFEGYNPFLDPIHIYPMHLPRKIMWAAFFDHCTNF